MSAVRAYFDDRHRVMERGNRGAGIRAFCYDQQAALVESMLSPGTAVLDVGCGPSLPYRSESAWVIGLDPSWSSLNHNTDVDVRMVGAAEDIRLSDGSVDLVVAFYSLHHMTGETSFESYLIRSRALREMYRVLAPGGSLLVFEMAPSGVAATVQRWCWGLAKRLLGHRLDAYFWTAEELARALPEPMTVRTFSAPAWTTFAPVFSLPWFRVPRWLYPCTPMLCAWTKPTDRGVS